MKVLLFLAALVSLSVALDNDYKHDAVITYDAEEAILQVFFSISFFPLALARKMSHIVSRKRHPKNLSRWIIL